MEQADAFTVNDLASKFRAKSELINILSREGNVYLPPKRDITQNYLRDLLRGEKLYVKTNKVVVLNVPQYEGLRVRDLLRFARSKLDIDKYLPDYEYHKEPNREWFCNLLNILVQKEFNEFLNKKIQERNKKLIDSQHLNVNVKPEF